MAEVVMRVRLMSGEHTDVTYADPEIEDLSELIDHVISTLRSAEGSLPCRHGERLIVLFGRGVSSVEIGPRGAVL